MKNMFLFVPVSILGLAGFSFAGECIDGFCGTRLNNKPAPPKVVSKEVVKSPKKSVPSCTNGKCHKPFVIKKR